MLISKQLIPMIVDMNQHTNFVLMTRILFIILLSIPFSGNAQRPGGSNDHSILGSVSGMLLDSIARDPVDYASVGIIDAQTGKIINGSITDERGIFRIGELPLGTVKLILKNVLGGNMNIWRMARPEVMFKIK